MNKLAPFLLAALLLGPCLGAKDLLEIKGDYLLYSFDFNYIYGMGNIVVKAKDFSVTAAAIEVDMASRSARLSRGCRVQLGKESHAADLLDINLENLCLKFTAFKDTIESWTVATQKKGTAKAAAPAVDAPPRPMTFRDYEALKKSLVYFLNGRIVITGSYRLYGYQSIVFIEGIQSLAFKKFKLDKGLNEPTDNGFGIDKIWFYPSQGLVVNSHLLMEKPVKHGMFKSMSGLDLKYDIFGDEVVGSRLTANFNSQNALPLSPSSTLNLNVSYLSDNMLSASLNFKKQWTPSFRCELLADYSQTAAKKEELWLRLRSDLNAKVLGHVAANLSYELGKQYLLELSWQNQALKHFVVSAQHSSSKLLYDPQQYNRLSNSGFSLSYSNTLFNLVADYSFHKDLLLDQSQASPQLRLNVSPFRLYNGLLQVNLFSSFIINQLNNRGVRNEFSKANMGLSLQSEPMRLGRGPEVSFSLAGEQLLDQDPENNFTSLGCIVRCSQSLTGFADFNFLYNYQTRRKTEKWFIQGTTSQDWSAVLKLKEKANRIQGWVSLSYDTKAGHFTSGLLDASLAIIKNWHIQTQLNYDFVFKNFSYDLYLIRRAGRIMIRGSYRSLSKQFLLEVLPN